jgi:hypothetical protein
LCRLADATDELLAEFFGKSVSTISRWKVQHPEFSEALKRGKLPADVEVANSLFKRANGFEYDEATPIKVKDITYADNGKKLRETERVEIIQVRKVVPPDVAACIYLLNNRQPQYWRQRRELIDPDGGGGLTINIIRFGDADQPAQQLAATTISATAVELSGERRQAGPRRLPSPVG